MSGSDLRLADVDVAVATAHEGLVEPGERVLVLGGGPEPICGSLGPWVPGPDPWRRAEYLDGAFDDAWVLHGAILPLLAERLDSLHGTAHGARYWSVLVGSWLLGAIHVLIDRQARLGAVRDVAPRVILRIPEGATDEPLADPVLWSHAIQEDDWNAAVYASFARRIGLRVEERAPRRSAASPLRRGVPRVERLARSFTQEVSRMLGVLRLRFVSHAPREHDHALFAASYHFTPADVLLLRQRVPGLAVGRSKGWTLRGAGTLDADARRNLCELPYGGPWATQLLPLIGRWLPRCFVEGYPVVRDASRRIWGERPMRCIVDGSVVYGGDLPLLEYAARCAAGGGSLELLQHGGGYGHFRLRPEERVERHLADRFLTWGWTDDAPAAPAIPMANPHLCRLAATHRGGEAIVLTDCEFPRHVHSLMSCPVGEHFMLHRQGVARFIESLPPDLVPKVAYKGYDHGYGWSDPPEILRRVRRSPAGVGTRAWEWNRIARIAVIAYPDTAFLEALVMGVPTIGLWNPELWGMRADAAPGFEALKQAGIVYHDPEGAADAVARSYAGADEWWRSAEVQEARSRFIGRWARPAGEWWAEWSSYLAAGRSA